MTSRKRITRFIRNVSISIAVLLVICIVIGLVYTWFIGKSQPVIAPVVEPTATKTTTKRTEVSPNIPESASVQSLTSPVMPGENASVIIKTNPGSWCTITVMYDKTLSKDSGLTGKTADEFGSVTWAWTVDSTASVGTWPVTVTCLRNKLSAVVVGDLVVKTKIDN